MLTVEDTVAPEIQSLNTELWPPNHKMATVLPSDCVAVFDACDAAPHVEFTWATSDESVNDNGDGNTDPDIILTADSVQLRAERQGGGDGRVYTLGYRVTDAAGHIVDGQCTVTVPHDQSGGESFNSGAAYTVSP